MVRSHRLKSSSRPYRSGFRLLVVLLCGVVFLCTLVNCSSSQTPPAPLPSKANAATTSGANAAAAKGAHNTTDFLPPAAGGPQKKAFTPTPMAGTYLTPISVAEAKRLAQERNKAQQELGSWNELRLPLERALRYAQGFEQSTPAILHSGLVLTWEGVCLSLHSLLDLLPRLDAQPELLAEHFVWLHLRPQTHFTSYYSPVLKASHEPTEEFPHPLYRLPEELAPDLAHCLPTHTCPEEEFTRLIKPEDPYFGRAQIDLDGALQGRGLEMAYVAHPFDAYLLMLQGSGVLQFPDGSQRAVLFAGLNGNSGQSMAGYLISTRQLSRAKADIHGMRAWWDAATAKERRDFLTAASGYVFFRYGADTPQGTAGCPLTPWVSMAVDPDVVPLGSILAFDLPAKQARQGLGFAHDTGSAIQGRRIDMYAGAGLDARARAMQIYTKGQIWILIDKAFFEKNNR